MNLMEVGVVGSGTMGAGIAQVAAQSGHKVVLVDTNQDALKKAKWGLEKVFEKLVEKLKIDQEKAKAILNNITYSTQISDFSNCGLIIEAIIERLDVKHQVFKSISNDCFFIDIV